MRTARWSVTSVVLVLILASTSAAADEKITADGYSDEIGILKEASFTEGAGGSWGSGDGGGSVSGGGGVPVCGVTGVTVMLPGGDRAEYRLCRRVEPVVSVEGVPVVVSASDVSTLFAEEQALREAALSMPKPERPAGMDEFTVEGAVATGEYVLALYPYVYATGDLSDWQAMSDPECGFCNNVITKVTKLHDAGGWVDPSPHEVVAERYGVAPKIGRASCRERV